MITTQAFNGARQDFFNYASWGAVAFAGGFPFIIPVTDPNGVGPEFRSLLFRLVCLVVSLILFSSAVRLWMRAYKKNKAALECPTCKNWLGGNYQYVLNTGKCKRCQTQIISDL